jgi:hypothetical protein
VADRGTADIAKAYLDFLFTDEAQEVIARLGYRPGAAEKAGVHFTDAKLVPASTISPDWNSLNDKFFADNGLVTAITSSARRPFRNPILGFMTAASIQLAIGQVSNALGVRNKGTGDQHLLYRLWLTLTDGDPINWKAVATCIGTFVLAIILRRVARRFKLPQFDVFASLLIVGVAAFLLGWTVPGADGRAILRVGNGAEQPPCALHSRHQAELDSGALVR